jgi:UDP-N-acetylglucosamine:LPS N-acetylglucosamine transferase
VHSSNDRCRIGPEGGILVLTGIEDRPQSDSVDGTYRGLRICLIASAGGHLSELEALASALGLHEVFLVTTSSPYSTSVLPGIRRSYVRRIVRNPANFVLNFVHSVSILVRERPDVIVSTGAGDALPLMWVAIALGIPVVYMETMARVFKMSLTGRMVRRWVSLMLVQWRSLKEQYPGVVCVNPLIQLKRSVRPLPSSPSILILTGTAERGFERLLRGVDLLVEEGSLPYPVFAQIGHSNYVPRHYPHERFLPHSRLIAAIEGSDLVITHDGAGSMREALSLGKPTIVLPRKSAEGELLFRSDFELAQRLDDLGWIEIVKDPREVPGAIVHLSLGSSPSEPQEGRDAVEVLSEFLGCLTKARQEPMVRTDQIHSPRV